MAMWKYRCAALSWQMCKSNVMINADWVYRAFVTNRSVTTHTRKIYFTENEAKVKIAKHAFHQCVVKRENGWTTKRKIFHRIFRFWKQWHFSSTIAFSTTRWSVYGRNKKKTKQTNFPSISFPFRSENPNGIVIINCRNEICVCFVTRTEYGQKTRSHCVRVDCCACVNSRF